MHGQPRLLAVGLGLLSTLAIPAALAQSSDHAASQAAPMFEAQGVLATYDTCVGRCSADRTTDRITCALNCVGSTIANLEEAKVDTKACIKENLETLAHCGVDCDAMAESPTDHDTCHLVCRSEALAGLRNCRDVE